jgi:hypothetical protein
MTHEVFISYSHHDKAIADGVCANLEQAGIRCWIAPRDIAPGYDWPTAISAAIKTSRVMVLIFSSRSNSSDDVGRELILAANNKLIIVPFKIEDVAPEPGKEYYLARTHWLDAMDPPTQEQVDKLVSCVRTFLVEAEVDFPGKPVEKQPPVKQTLQPVPPVPVATTQPSQVSPGKEAKSPRMKPRKSLALPLGIGIVGIIFLLGVLLIWQGVFEVPALSNIFSHPTPTLAITKTPLPTNTPTHTSTHLPTRTPLPSWVTDFAQPILDTVARQDFDFEGQTFIDYRGWLDANCAPPNIDMADSAYALFAKDCKFSWKSWFTDFVIRMVVRMEPVDSREPDSQWTFYYRSFNGFTFFYNGKVESAFAGGFAAPDALLPGSVENEIVIIVKNQEQALIINGQPIFYGPLPAGYENGIGSWIVNDPVTIKVIEIWDISNLP